MLIEYRLLHGDTLLYTRPQPSVPDVGHLVTMDTADGSRGRYRVVAVQWPLDLRRPVEYYSLVGEVTHIVQVYLVEVSEEEETG